MSIRYDKSEQMLHEALEVIPLGSQTFSKSKVQFPYGAAPFFVTKGNGSKIWDVDDNEYVDFVNGLLAVMLGYNDPDVNKAVQNQLQQGVSFSMPHPIEVQVAKKVIEMVPCAELVRFGKNGSDATAGAIRLARAYTDRDHVAVCGYHGWQDWYIGSTARHLGVPQATRDLTHPFAYNDLADLEKIFQTYPEKIAAVILEPMNVAFPKPGFLEGVKELAHQHGALFILDETITGFRFANGGAQEYFKVIPDLATFGKGVGNGFPISIITGRKDIMQLMDKIFFSFTFGGEAVSLAATLAVMEKLQREPVVEHLLILGTQVIKGVQALIDKYELQKTLKVCGHPAWSFLIFSDTLPYTQFELKTLWMQEILQRGIFSFGSHNMSYAHNDADVKKLLSVYDEVFPIIKRAIHEKSLDSLLHCQKLEPLFSVRKNG